MPRFETIRSSCRHVDGRRLLFGRAMLSSYAVDVSGWIGLRRYARHVPLDRVRSVARHTVGADENLEFELADGRRWAIRVSAPGLWRLEADQRILARRAGEVTEPASAVQPPAASPAARRAPPSRAVPETPGALAPVSPAAEDAAVTARAALSPWSAWGGAAPAAEKGAQAASAPRAAPARPPAVVPPETYVLTEAYPAPSPVVVGPRPGRAVTVDAPVGPRRRPLPDWKPIRLIGVEARDPWRPIAELAGD